MLFGEDLKEYSLPFTMKKLLLHVKKYFGELRIEKLIRNGALV